MEALIHHFKIFTEGFKVPEGEVYVGDRVARGASSAATSCPTAAAKPYRMHIRGPSFVNLQALPAHDARRPHRRRRRRHLLGRPDPGRRGPLMARLTDANVAHRRARSSARYPRPKSALIPLLHLAQEQDGYVTDDAMAHIAELVGVHAGRGARHGHASTRCSSSSRSGRYCVNICTNISCQLLGGEELLEHAEETLGVKAGGTTADGLFTLEDVECIAACTEAPCLQVNYRYRYKVTQRRLRPAGRRPRARAGSTTRSRRTARSPASASRSRRPTRWRRQPEASRRAGRMARRHERARRA